MLYKYLLFLLKYIILLKEKGFLPPRNKMLSHHLVLTFINISTKTYNTQTS